VEAPLKGVPEQYIKIAENAGMSREELEDFLKKLDVPSGPGGDTVLGIGERENRNPALVEREAPLEQQIPSRPSERASRLPSDSNDGPGRVKVQKALPKAEIEIPSKEDLANPEVLAQLMRNLPQEGIDQLAQVFESLKKGKATSPGAKDVSKASHKSRWDSHEKVKSQSRDRSASLPGPAGGRSASPRPERSPRSAAVVHAGAAVPHRSGSGERRRRDCEYPPER
jgi:hypothetical protein